MAGMQVSDNFPGQLAQARRDIRDSFQRSHEALQAREDALSLPNRRDRERVLWEN